MSSKYYDQSEIWDRDLTPQESERISIVNKFIPEDVKTILDAGSGNGAISNYLKGYDITAMDRSPEALKYVTNKAVLGDIEKLPFQDKSFDLIICSDVLEHLSPKIYQNVLAELKRVSKKYILIISPNSEDLESNFSKCEVCGTTYHLNWHIQSISLNKIIEDFKSNFSPLIYSYFGDLWSYIPKIKYNIKRLDHGGYKNWENAVCPMCGSSNESNDEENYKELDIKYNKNLDGFYNSSTEFIVLLTNDEDPLLSIRGKFDCGFILSDKKIESLQFINRQTILVNDDLFHKPQTIHYPQFGYILDNPNDEPNRVVFCMPYLGNEKLLNIDYVDNIEGTISINVYDLEKGYINISNVSLTASGSTETLSIHIPPDIIPANEGLIFEIVGLEHSLLNNLSISKIYIDSNEQLINLKQKESINFMGEELTLHQYDNNGLNWGFFVIQPDTYVYDSKFGCLFLNLETTFEYFYPPLYNSYDFETLLQEANTSINSEGETLDLIDQVRNIIKESPQYYAIKDDIQRLINQNTSLETRINQINSEASNRISRLEKLEHDVNLFAEESKIEKTINVHINNYDEIDSRRKFEVTELTNNLDDALKQLETVQEYVKDFDSDLKILQTENYQNKAQIYSLSNSIANVIKNLKNPFRAFYKLISQKLGLRRTNTPQIESEVSSKPIEYVTFPDEYKVNKHLLILTPDVRIDRRTVQMCRSLIEELNINCTIVGALEDNDDFISDRLKVVRVDPYNVAKYIPTPEESGYAHVFNLDEFYWLHYNYLTVALSIDCDFVMCCDLPLLPAAYHVSQVKKIPLIYDAHELYPEQACFTADQRNLYTSVESYYVKFPNLVITVNESIASEMAERYEISKPDVILNAIDSPDSFNKDTKFNHFREQLNIREDQKIVLYQGSYSPNRNLDLLVKSAVHINRKDVVIVLMGFGEYKKELEVISKQDNTFNEKVFFFAAVSQSVLIEYSSSADVGIIPYPHIDLNSFYCTPNKLFEFVQARLPIIANDSPELNRFINGYSLGITQKIENEVDIANLIDKYFDEFEGNIVISDETVQKMSWQYESQKFIEVIRPIIEDQSNKVLISNEV